MRKLTPELLDSLPADDSGAIASRKDLARINSIMGNYRWILRSIPDNATEIVELGAGSGDLIHRISKDFPGAKCIAYDLASRPAKLRKRVIWKQVDILKSTFAVPGATLVANLILHHFTDDQISSLAPSISQFRELIFSEPHRAKAPLAFGKFAAPLLHPVTRHDMRVSIEAGFQKNELSALLHLDSSKWIVKETTDFRGALRFHAKQR